METRLLNFFQFQFKQKSTLKQDTNNAFRDHLQKSSSREECFVVKNPDLYRTVMQRNDLSSAAFT